MCFITQCDKCKKLSDCSRHIQKIKDKVPPPKKDVIVNHGIN